MKIMNIFNQDFDSTIVNLQQCYWSLSKSKKNVLYKKKEYNENLNTYNINKDYFSKSATGKTILDNIENRFDCYKKNFVKFLNEQENNQNKIKKSIRSIYNKNIDLQELEEYDIIVTQDKYNELLVTLTKAHKDGLVDKEKVLELTEFKRIDFKKGSIYVKDNRVNYADCIVINEFNEILLLKRNKLDDFEAGKYCLPGGHVDKGEDFEYAALRELIEETGIKAETAIFSGKYLDNKVAIHYFTIQVKKDDCNIFLDEREHQQFTWVPIEELSKYPLIKNLDKNFQEVILIPTSVINTHIASNIFSYYNNGHFIKSEDSEAIVIANEIYKSIKDGVIGEYELEKHIKESNLGTQNFIICKPSLGPIYGVKAIENIEKAHKYYFREGSPGNYKYYYTRDEYIKAKGKDQIDSKPKQDIVGQIESKLEDKINEIIKATEDAEFARTGFQISDYEKELLRLSLLQDMFNSIGKYVEETDELVAFSVNQSLKGNFTIQMNINRDGQVRHLETDVIYAGGYNIQKLHLRYITNTDLVPKSTTLTNKYKDKAAKLTKLQRLEKDVKYYEGVVERYKKEIAEREVMSDEDKALAGGGYDIMKKVTWQELVERGADENYDYSEQVFIDKTAKLREDNIKRFNEHTRYIKDYLKSAEKDLAKRIQRVEDFNKTDNIEKSEKIKGGLADGETVEELAAHHKTSIKKIYDEIEIGKKVEMEHTDDPDEALEITMDHLWEIPDYYTRLAKMEKEAKDDIEKGKAAQIGEIRTWSGIKMKKTSEGWFPVKEEKSKTKEDEQSSDKNKETDKKQYSEKELSEFAKQTSEGDLWQAAAGEDEQLRIAAKKELERRNTEENPENKDKPVEKTKEDKESLPSTEKIIEKLRTLSDEQIKHYYNVPYDRVKNAAKFIADERGLTLEDKFEPLEFNDSIEKMDDFIDSFDKNLIYQYSFREEESLIKYRQDSSSVNNSLRFGGDIDPNIEYIDSVFEKKLFKLNSDIISYRGIGTDNNASFTSFLESLKPGDVFQDKGFVSTTLSSKVKDDFIPKSDVGKPMYLEIRIRKGQNIIPMSLMGENDSRVDIMYGEYEILLNRNSKFKVLENKTEDTVNRGKVGKLIVELI